MQKVQAPLPLGATIRTRYKIESILSNSDAGTIYLIKDLQAEQKLFALKEVFNPNNEERHRFTLDYVTLTQLDHAALPCISAVFNDDKQARAYILMQYIEGTDLEILRQQQPEQHFSVDQVKTMLAPIVNAILYLHSQKPSIVHRDITPANMIIPKTSNEAMLLQFGIPEEYIPDAIIADLRQSLPGYKAPEQYDLEADARTDVYGLAATCYTLLTGVVPANAFYRQTKLDRKEADPLLRIHDIAPTLPAKLADTLHRALSIQRNERFASVEQFWKAFQEAAQEPIALLLAKSTIAVSSTPLIVAKEGVAAAAKKTPVIQHASPTVPTFYLKKRTVVFSILLLLLLLIGVGVYFFTAPSSHTPSNASASQTQQTVTTSSTSPATSPATAIAHPTSQPTAATTQGVSSPHSTPKPVSYPSILGSYAGTVGDLTGAMKTNMSLKNIQQNQGTIQGTFSGLQINGAFYGSIDPSGHIHFSVTDNAGHITYFFDGDIQSATSLSGSYYSCAMQSNQCRQQSNGAGIWQVSRM